LRVEGVGLGFQAVWELEVVIVGRAGAGQGGREPEVLGCLLGLTASAEELSQTHASVFG
jgi:hypothetical protein